MKPIPESAIRNRLSRTKYSAVRIRYWTRTDPEHPKSGWTSNGNPMSLGKNRILAIGCQ